jgi:hypothetical protein
MEIHVFFEVEHWIKEVLRSFSVVVSEVFEQFIGFEDVLFKFILFIGFASGLLGNPSPLFSQAN